MATRHAIKHAVENTAHSRTCRVLRAAASILLASGWPAHRVGVFACLYAYFTRAAIVEQKPDSCRTVWS
eukprot:4805210-Prymnesium_polylepis.1